VIAQHRKDIAVQPILVLGDMLNQQLGSISFCHLGSPSGRNYRGNGNGYQENEKKSFLLPAHPTTRQAADRRSVAVLCQKTVRARLDAQQAIGRLFILFATPVEHWR
jgi:hypothetical protein